MRKDMNKILVERSRIHPWHGPKGRGREKAVDIEEQPLRERMRSHPFRKVLNENLAPLRRFIQSRVGKPWDKVYSEIREHISTDNAVQMHIMQHLWGYVERQAVVTDAGVFYNRWGNLYPLGSGDFYVHPKTGLLCQVPHTSKKAKKEQRTDIKKIMKNFIALQIDGVWFGVALEELPTKLEPILYPPDTRIYGYRCDSRYDVVLQQHVARRVTNWWNGKRVMACDDTLKAYENGEVYAKSKRQLSSRELVKYKLK